LRTYEALYIVSPEVDDDGIQTISKETENLVTGVGGEIVRSEIWGRRKMAYEVKRFSEGSYILLRFTAPPDFIARLESTFKLNESIIRYLVVHFDEHTLRLEEEQQRRRKEELARSAARTEDDDDDDDAMPVGGGRRGRRDHDEDED
jgi:small subunit ribosomal protein S6